MSTPYSIIIILQSEFTSLSLTFSIVFLTTMVFQLGTLCPCCPCPLHFVHLCEAFVGVRPWCSLFHYVFVASTSNDHNFWKGVFLALDQALLFLLYFQRFSRKWEHWKTFWTYGTIHQSTYLEMSMGGRQWSTEHGGRMYSRWAKAMGQFRKLKSSLEPGFVQRPSLPTFWPSESPPSIGIRQCRNILGSVMRCESSRDPSGPFILPPTSL